MGYLRCIAGSPCLSILDFNLTTSLTTTTQPIVMPLFFKEVFDVMNNDDSLYEAEEILRNFTAQRDPPQASSTPEKRVPSRSPMFSSSSDSDVSAISDVSISDVSGDEHDLGITFDIVNDRTPGQSISGVGRFDETRLSREIPENMDVPPERERPLPIENQENTDVPAERPHPGGNRENPDVPAERPLPLLEKGSKSSRKRKRNLAAKHPILNVCPTSQKLLPMNEIPHASGCSRTCRKLCGENFNASAREEIHKQFWEMNYDERSTWLAAQVTSRKPVRIRVSEEDRVKERSRIHKYSLPNNGEDIEVFQILLISVPTNYFKFDVTMNIQFILINDLLEPPKKVCS